MTEEQPPRYPPGVFKHLNKYEPSEKLVGDINNRFTYHTPKEGQPERYMYLRDQARLLALDILRATPPSREQSAALTTLEEAIMFANAAIARHE